MILNSLCSHALIHHESHTDTAESHRPFHGRSCVVANNVSRLPLSFVFDQRHHFCDTPPGRFAVQQRTVDADWCSSIVLISLSCRPQLTSASAQPCPLYLAVFRFYCNVRLYFPTGTETNRRALVDSLNFGVQSMRFLPQTSAHLRLPCCQLLLRFCPHWRCFRPPKMLLLRRRQSQMQQLQQLQRWQLRVQGMYTPTNHQFCQCRFGPQDLRSQVVSIVCLFCFCISVCVVDCLRCLY